MHYYSDPETDTIAGCPACGGDKSRACSGSYDYALTQKRSRKVGTAGFSGGLVRLVVIMMLSLIFLMTIGTFSLLFLDFTVDVPRAFMEPSGTNTWFSHVLLSVDDSRVPGIEIQDQIYNGQMELEVRSPVGKIEHLRPFSSIRELKQFLQMDATSELQYSMDFDCDDFAFCLSQNAMNMGYQIFPFAEGDHLKNVAHVALGTGSTAVYVIEPQTDEISLWGRVD